MKKIIVSILTIGLLLSTALINVSGQESIIPKAAYAGVTVTQTPSNGSLQLPRYAPGELIVKFQKDAKIHLQSVKGIILTGLSAIDNLNNKYGSLKSAKLIFKNSPVHSLSNVYKFSFSSGTDTSSLVKDYNLEPCVVYAEPNYIYSTYGVGVPQIPKVNPIPNDPLFGQQWALSKIHATSGWAIEKGSPDVTIAIVDTGVDYNHPDLAANIWHDPINGNPGYDFVDINTTLYIEQGFTLCPDEDYTVPDANPMDHFGHGTHCAGIASAVTNNSIGVAGVCWDCKIMPVRAGFKIKYGGETTASLEEDNIANATIYAADKGANVISMSWGSSYYDSNLIRDSLDYAHSKGVALVAAAGNDNLNAKYFYPASYENVISVAATDNSDNRASFSNYGESVDVAAPGVDILSLRASGTDMYGDGTHIVDEKYYTASGTSMACPHVAGLAALILSKNQNCPYPAQMVESMMPLSTDKIDTDQYIGTGRISAYKALVQEPFAALLDSIPNWEDVKGKINITGAAWGGNFRYFVLEDGFGENPSSWTLLKNSSTPQGGVLLALNTKQLAEGLHTIRLKVACAHGTYTDDIQIYVNNEADGTYTANIYVSDCFNSSMPGWGVTKFASIQDGINHAQSGDTVFVYDGIYPEDVKLSSKSISLIGQHNRWTIIDGGGRQVNINSARQVTVNGFNIREQLLLRKSSKCTISNNIIALSYEYVQSIYNKILLNISDFNTITLFMSSNNIISGNIIGSSIPVPTYFIGSEFPAGLVGISLTLSSENTISNNTINCWSSIELGWLSDKNVIDNNVISYYPSVDGWNTAGIGMGLVFSNVIRDNFIKSEGEEAWGISLVFSCGNTIIQNNITGHEVLMGIDLVSSSSLNRIIANEITVLAKAINIDDAKYNKIYYNNCYDGGAWDAYGNESGNLWYKEKLIGRSMGNYWSCYKAYNPNAHDSNNDGIWDDPFFIQCSTGEPNQDKYPVVNPIDIKNIDVNSEMAQGMTSEESQYLTQLENVINSQILAGEYNIANSGFYIYPVCRGSTGSQSQGNLQNNSTPQNQQSIPSVQQNAQLLQNLILHQQTASR